MPFNIASSALLVHIIAKLTNLKPGFLTHFIGDAHIYKNHIDALKKQLKNKLFYLPKLQNKKIEIKYKLKILNQAILK